MSSKATDTSLRERLLETRRVRINVGKPRHVYGQADIWYYLPGNRRDPNIHLYISAVRSIKIPARKLYRELKAIYEKRVMK